MTGQPETVDLAELRRLAEDATPGPWKRGRSNADRWVYPDRPDADKVPYEHIARVHTDADAAYIVALVNAAPALLSRIEALETALGNIVSPEVAIATSQSLGEYLADAYRAARALLDSRG